MEKLITIQKREKLNDVYVIDEKGNGGGNHHYQIMGYDNDGDYKVFGRIQFQDGARKLEDSTHGIIDSDLIEIVKHRLESFQQGEFASRENALVLTHLEEALLWMNKRVEDRIERNVLGTNNK